MSNNDQKRRNQWLADYLNVLEKFYAILGTNTPNPNTSYQKLAAAIGEKDGVVMNLKTLLGAFGILNTEIIYNPIVDGVRTMGRKSNWTLVEPIESARQKLIDWEKKGDSFTYEHRADYKPMYPTAKEAMANNKAAKTTLNGDEPVPGQEVTQVVMNSFPRRGEEPVTIAKREKEEVRAIAGPEPQKPFAGLASMRKDEPAALIEAAKQYMNRQNAVEAQYQSLVTMGLDVDKEQFLKSIKLPKDSFLDSISLVVPYIASLQMRNSRLIDEANALRDKVKDYAEVKHNYERLQKRWNERVAAQLTAESARNASAPRPL